MVMRGRAAVIGDVARLAGVSHQTVSRVLNDHRAVSGPTRERVLAAIRELGYRPNAMARGLVRGSRVIGVVASDTILYGPASTLLGIERAARAEGYGVSIVTVARADDVGVLAALETLAGQSVAGAVVVAPHAAAATALFDERRGMATVTVEGDVDGTGPSVGVDHVAGARLAVEHLLGLGHRSVWHVSGPLGWPESRDRIAGWRAALERAGIAAPRPFTGDWSARSGYAAGLALAERPGITAVFAGNDQMALGVIRALRERGFRIPTDVSVVGFDDIPEAEYLWPPLTTVRQDFDEVGRRCIAALLRQVEAVRQGGRAEARPEPKVTPTLVVRASAASVRR
ncbi:LacI family DNA-binding transcriptional regulator [Dactylosporangium sp. NPDC005572]|uniref:LacI family DNA-binding transcriptional regulator n=1 Tax=Dactylosporangium sp. NPDC005572 TaxID=3156889 RepID=UPI0033A456AA